MTQHTDSIQFFYSISDVPKVPWNTLVHNQTLFLSLPYLEAIEQSKATSLRLIYVLISAQDGTPLLAGVFQIATFTYKKGAQANLLLKLFQDCKNKDNSISIKGLICGNIFATGRHGFAYNSLISLKSACELMATAAKSLKQNEGYDDEFSVMLFKDFNMEDTRQAEVLDDFKYRSFQADVAMALPLMPHWITFEDYLQCMKAKYRTKANSAYKKSKDLVIQSLTVSVIEQHEARLQVLFTNILDKSDYQYGEDYPKCFSALKKNLGASFICKGAFYEGTMVGFSTAFVNGSSLEASYVGIDYRFNTEHAIYERLLYDFVEQAIQLQVAFLHLGRTSELIKSALGAIPEAMSLFVKHRSKLKNALLKPLVENITPSEYSLRRPFKSKYYTD